MRHLPLGLAILVVILIVWLSPRASPPTFDTIDYLGQTIKLRRPYIDYEDY